MIKSRRGLIGDKLTHNAAFKASVFQLFRAFNFVTVTIEKPNSHRYVVVKSKINLMSWFDNEGFSLLV